MKRFLADHRLRSGLLATLAAGLLAGPAAARAEASGSDAALREAARPGAFCSFSSCRPRAPSPFTGAAFGAAVVAIGWQARRRDKGEA